MKADWIHMKECKKCKNNYPLNTDYYFKKKDTTDGYTTRCKECMGYTFTKLLEVIDGECVCKKCNRFLPQTSEYFPKDKTTLSGLRNVCHECKGSRFGKRKERVFWTEDEDNILKQYYEIDIIDNYIGLLPNRNRKSIIDRAHKLGLKQLSQGRQKRYEKHSAYMKENSNLIGRVVTEEEKLRTSQRIKKLWEENYDEMYKNVSYERTEYHRENVGNLAKERGQWKGDKNPRHLRPLNGSENGNWRGGITPFINWSRNLLGEWKQDSMRFCNYKCVITGENFDEIHHLTSFKNILDEVISNLKWDAPKNLEEFSVDELEIIREEVLKTNYKYGLGVCLTKEVHKLFHDTYGYGDNSPEQFEEFSIRFKNGEFNNIINNVC